MHRFAQLLGAGDKVTGIYIYHGYTIGHEGRASCSVVRRIFRDRDDTGIPAVQR